MENKHFKSQNFEFAFTNLKKWGSVDVWRELRCSIVRNENIESSFQKVMPVCCGLFFSTVVVKLFWQNLLKYCQEKTQSFWEVWCKISSMELLFISLKILINAEFTCSSSSRILGSSSGWSLDCRADLKTYSNLI